MNTYQRYLIEEFADDYHERTMSRRDLLKRAVLIMGSVPAGLSALAAVGCGGDDDDDTEEATQALGSPTTPATPEGSATPSASPTNAGAGVVTVEEGDFSFQGPASDLFGYLARPGNDAVHPRILVIHENRGLNEHTKDIARRYATEGFIALAVDLCSRNGGSTTDTARNTGFLGSADPDDLVADMLAYVDHLQGLEGVQADGIGVTGFCFGGGYTFETAVASPEVKAAVPYYGTARNVLSELATTQAAILVMYGANDSRITSEAEQVRAELEKSGRPFGIEIYPGANHAFFNDTGSNYNQAAAEDAWTKTLAWFRDHL
ncbi:MAG: dienelactone hydrolase family protein [Dehalococcoidia bacterium]